MSNLTHNAYLDCPSNHDLLAFHRANLKPMEMDSIQSHLESCDSCIVFLDSQDERSDTIVHALTALTSTTDDEIEFQRLREDLLSEPEVVATDAWLPDFGELYRRHPQDRIGDQIGEYKLLELLGCGANGAVYKAQHQKLDRPFTIKLLDPIRLHDPQTLDFFLNEIKAVGRLDHPNIVQATDAGNLDGQYYLVMEYVAGMDVSRMLRRLGKLEIADAADIICQVANGLKFAHENGMIHRDVKPSNMFFDYSGTVKLLDLGLVAISESPEFDAPQIAARGTADYMSPEQWTDFRHVDPRADIYSLGCAFFKLLIGHAPFAEIPENSSTKMHAHQWVPAPSLRQLRSDVPLGLDRIVHRMLQKQKQKRYDNMEEVINAVKPYAEASSLHKLAERLNPHQGNLQSDPIAQPAPRIISRRYVVAGLLTGTAAVAVNGFAFFQSKSNPNAPMDAWRTLTLNEKLQPVSLDQDAEILFDSTVDAVRVHASDLTIQPLGEPIQGEFEIQTAIHNLDPGQRAGLIFRYRPRKEEIGVLHPFQAVEVALVDNRLKVMWREYRWLFAKMKPDIREEIWASTELEKPIDMIRLKIEFGRTAVPAVRVNDVDLEESDWDLHVGGRHAKQITRSQLSQQYLGSVGLISNGPTTMFGATRLRYLN